jgi:hypothetical protein
MSMDHFGSSFLADLRARFSPFFQECLMDDDMKPILVEVSLVYEPKADEALCMPLLATMPAPKPAPLPALKSAPMPASNRVPLLTSVPVYIPAPITGKGRQRKEQAKERKVHGKERKEQVTMATPLHMPLIKPIRSV